METKFNFKSQVCTSIEQSRRLLELGLKKETADMCYKVITHDFKGNEIKKKDRDHVLCCWYDESSQVCGLEQKKTIPAWSLHRLIELKQPNKIDNAVVILSREQTYDKLIGMIAKSIKGGDFPKEYLV